MLRCSLLCLVPKSTCKPHEQTAVAWTSKGLQIRLHVKPNSTADRVLDLRKDCLDVAVTKAARDNEANRGVIDLMSRVLAVKKSEVTIVAGQKSRSKIMLVLLSQHASKEHGQHDDLVQIVKKLKEATIPSHCR